MPMDDILDRLEQALPLQVLSASDWAELAGAMRDAKRYGLLRLATTDAAVRAAIDGAISAQTMFGSAEALDRALDAVLAEL